MPRLYDNISHDLAYLAVLKAFENKWLRGDVRTFIEEWTGYSREELLENELERGQLSFGLKHHIINEVAYVVEDMIDGIMNGIDPDFTPVFLHRRADGATGKVRDIAYLSIKHQLLGHTVYQGLKKLLNKRITPTQHASIPEHGQTRLARQIRRMLNRKLGIRYFVKTDCTGAYASVSYDLVICLIGQEIPRAKWIIKSLEVLKKYAPGGHLIIGGFLDAWLFNFVMSYALQYVESLGKIRRGKRIQLVIRSVTFMDDMMLAGRSRSALIQAVKDLKEWLWVNFGMTLRTTTDVIRLYTIEEEKAHKHRETPAGRSVPMIDMGGFKICHSFITIRRRNIPRIIRCMERAWEEYKATGTIKRQRACQIISRNGMLKNSFSYTFCHKYHVYELMRVAKSVQAYWARVERRKRRERIIHVVEKHRKQRAAVIRADG